MDVEEWTRAAYGKVVDALDETLSSLDRLAGGEAGTRGVSRKGMFHLGVAGGLAFSGRLPGIEADALFDDISDAAEKRDPDQVGRIRESVAARPGPDDPRPGNHGLDWPTGPLQMLAVLNEACTARVERDAVRFSLMTGFLVGLIPERFRRFQHGFLRDAVLAAHEPEIEAARAWVEAESIEAGERKGGAAGADPRAPSPPMGGSPPRRGTPTVLPAVPTPRKRVGRGPPDAGGRGEGVLRDGGGLGRTGAELREENRRPGARAPLASRELRAEPGTRAPISGESPPA